MFNNFKVGSRLFFLITLATVITIVVALFGTVGMKEMNASSEEMYTNNVLSLDAVGIIDSEINKMIGDIFRAFQHDPASPSSKYHAHAVDVHLNLAEERIKIADKSWTTYLAIHLPSEEKKLADPYRENYTRFIAESIRPAIASMRANDFSSEVISGFVRGYGEQGRTLEKLGVELIDLSSKGAKQQHENSKKTYDQAITYMLVAFGIGLIVSIFVSWQIIRSITTPLTNLQTTIVGVEDNKDFTLRTKISGSDEVGQTAEAFNQLLVTLQATLKGIFGHTNQLDVAATELSSIAHQVSQGSEMTSETSSSMAASIEEMTVSINNIAQSTQETSKITQHTNELSQQGGEVIRQTVNKMHAMAGAVRDSSESITKLGKQSERISGIVQVIKEVADQTNLLALNAAIEAARAGEQGRGFAVVADEVRKLAERTTKATLEIGEMIAAIQGSLQSTVGAMSHATEEVESGVTLADQAGTAITDIQSGSKETQTCVSETSTALTEQSTASQLIAQQVERVAQAAEENRVAANNSSEAAKRIEQLARTMREDVAKFRV